MFYIRIYVWIYMLFLYVGAGVCLDQITPSLDVTAFKPRAAGSSFRSTGAALRALRDSSHSCTVIGWLFHFGERQDGEGLASHEQGSAALFTQHPTGCTFTMCLIWMLTHRHEVQAERRGNFAPICCHPVCVTNATGCWRHSQIWAKYGRQAIFRPTPSCFSSISGMHSGLQPPHPFVDDAVTCDSSEANRAWSSLPAETLPWVK